MKKVMNFFCRITLMILAFVTSASSGVMMADASNLPDAGKMTAGADGTGGTDGIATETAGRENGDPNFYLSDVDKRIVKIVRWRHLLIKLVVMRNQVVLILLR